jgi:hypothetical protein
MGKTLKFSERTGVLKLKRRKRRAPLPTTLGCTRWVVALDRPLVKPQDLPIIDACALGTSKTKLCKYQLISKTNF